MNLRLGLAVLATAVIAACQSAPAPDGAAVQSAANGPSEGPEMICRMEYVTGSRVRKQEVCSPTKFNNAAGDGLRQHLNTDLYHQMPNSAGGG